MFKHTHKVSFDWYLPVEGVFHSDSIVFDFGSSCPDDSDMDFAYAIFLRKLQQYFRVRRLSFFSVFFRLTSWSKNVERD